MSIKYKFKLILFILTLKVVFDIISNNKIIILEEFV